MAKKSKQEVGTRDGCKQINKSINKCRKNQETVENIPDQDLKVKKQRKKTDCSKTEDQKLKPKERKVAQKNSIPKKNTTENLDVKNPKENLNSDNRSQPKKSNKSKFNQKSIKSDLLSSNSKKCNDDILFRKENNIVKNLNSEIYCNANGTKVSKNIEQMKAHENNNLTEYPPEGEKEELKKQLWQKYCMNKFLERNKVDSHPFRELSIQRGIDDFNRVEIKIKELEAKINALETQQNNNQVPKVEIEVHNNDNTDQKLESLNQVCLNLNSEIKENNLILLEKDINNLKSKIEQIQNSNDKDENLNIFEERLSLLNKLKNTINFHMLNSQRKFKKIDKSKIISDNYNTSTPNNLQKSFKNKLNLSRKENQCLRSFWKNTIKNFKRGDILNTEKLFTRYGLGLK